MKQALFTGQAEESKHAFHLKEDFPRKHPGADEFLQQ